MSSVDERVVKMRFDNAQFERGVQQTLTSLDNLKRKLQFNGVANGINAIVNTINGARMSKSLNSINSGMDAINKRFSALGIAGMEVVKRLTNAALNSVTRVATAIPNQIKAGGWERALNLENAQFQLNGLGIAWDKINNDIQYAVNGTAYGLDAAAKVAGQLAASNIEVSDSALTATKSVDDFSAACIGQTSAALKGNGQLDEMATALRSISGVASMSNSSFEEIGQIYTRVAGQGRVMADDLNSIASRGLNAAATLGKYLGKTETEVRDMVSKGQIDFKTFSDAMYDAYADQAVKANNTFQGALSNTKSALSRIGADVADDLLPALTKILNSCRNLFNQVHKWIQPILDSLGKLVSAVGDVISPIIDKITEKIRSITGVSGGIINQIAAVIDKITEKIKGILKVFGITGDKTEEVAQKASQATEKVADTVQHIDEMAKKVIHGDFGNGEARINALHAIGENYEKIQNRVNELLGCSFRYQVQEEKTASAIKNTASATHDATKNAQELTVLRDNLTKGHMLNGLLNIGKTIKFIFETIAEAVKTTSGKLFDDLKSLDKLSFTKGFDEFTGKLINSQKNMEIFKTVVTDIVSGIGNLLEAVGKIAMAFGKAFIETISEVNALNPTKTSSAFRKLTENLNLSKDGAEGLKDVFKLLLSPLKVIIPVMQTIGLVVLKIISAFAKLNSKILEFIGKSKLLKSIGRIFENLGKIIKEFFGGIAKTKGFQKFIDSVERFASVIGEKLGEAFDKLAGWLEKFSGLKFKSGSFDGISNGFSTFFNALSKVFDTFSDLIEGKTSIKNVLTKLGKSIKEGAEKLWKDVREGIKNIDFKQLGTDIKTGLSKIDIKGVFISLKDNISKAFSNFSFKDAFKGIGKKVSKDAADTFKEESTGESGLENGLENGLELGKGETVGAAIAESIKLPKLNLPSFKDVINQLGEIFEKIKSWLAPKINAAGQATKSAVSKFDFGKLIKNLWDIFTKIQLGKIIKGISDVFSGIGDVFKNAGTVVKSVSTLIKSVASVPKEVSDFIAQMKKSLKYKMSADTFKAFATGVLEIVGALMMLSMIKVEKLGPSVLALGVIMGGLVAVVKYVNDMELDSKKISALGKYGILMGVAILAISGALKKISGLKVGSLLQSVLALSSVIAVITKTLSSFNDSNINFGTAIGYGLSIGIVVTTVANGLSKLSKNNWQSYLGPAIIMTGVIIAVVKAINTLNENGPTFGQGLGYALAMAAVVAAVSNGLAILAGKDWGGLAAAALSMSVVIFAVAAAMKLAGSNIASAGQALGFAVLAAAVGLSLSALANQPMSGIVAAGIMMSVAMIALGAAMRLAGSNLASAVQALGFAVLAAAVGLSLSLLASMPVQGIIAAALGISVAAMGLALAGNIGAGAGPSLLIAAAAVGIFGAALAVASVGISTAIAVIINAIGSVLAVIPGMGNIGKSMKEAATGITDFNKSLVDFNTSDAKDPLEGVKNKIEGSKDKIKSDLSETKSVVQNGTKSLSDGTEGTGEKLKDNITSGTDEIPDKLASILEGVKSTVTSKVDETGAAAKGSTDNSLNEILSSVEGFDLSQGGSDLWSSVGNGISSNDLPFDITNMKMEDIKAMLSGEDLSPQGSHAASTMANGLSANQEAELVASIKSGNIDKILAGGDPAGAGAEKGSLYSDGLASTAGMSDQAGQTLTNASSNGADRASETLRGTGRRNGSAYVESINSKKPNATLAGRNLVNAASNGANANSNSLRSSGSSSGLAYATGVRSQAGSARSGGRSLSSSAVSGASGGYSGMYSAGSYASQGFANGINAYAALAASNASRMVRNAISAARRAADIRSPSRKTYKIGKYFVLGMVNAIADLGYMVSDYASSTVSNALDSMRNTLNDIMSGTEDNFDISPRIKPVVDLSDAMSGANSLHNMLSGSEAAVIDYGVSVRDQNERLSNQLSEKIRRSMEDLQAKNGTTNLYIDGIKYNTDSYIDGKIDDFVKDIIRKGGMYIG